MSFADILFVMNYVNLCVYSGRISRLQMACNAWVKLVTATPNPVRYQSTYVWGLLGTRKYQILELTVRDSRRENKPCF
jgi:hypothetical protein